MCIKEWVMEGVKIRHCGKYYNWKPVLNFRGFINAACEINARRTKLELLHCESNAFLFSCRLVAKNKIGSESISQQTCIVLNQKNEEEIMNIYI